ncbi:nuclear transport factor 2 family protein [Zobellella endophytica]|uniref:Nuclear transport factor 2 family protein n=1 Tax=Zobellella endophytica TaxID=2116700 RepID=A0A2P7R6E6_9GAMM|nr:nuclear transport factor 2 family protein [Zobellella endophytica]PSJ45789.1 nuclear transport factor 2 family protein [Zobellella endophytica]
MSPALAAFCRLYQGLSPAGLQALREVYAPDVHFCDPAHELRGVSALQAYFEGLFAHVSQCRFDIAQAMEQDGEAFIRWQMHLVHPRLNGGAGITVPGVSHLRFDGQVYYHRDYFDLGNLLYEQLPVLGGVIRALKRRLSA